MLSHNLVLLKKETPLLILFCLLVRPRLHIIACTCIFYSLLNAVNLYHLSIPLRPRPHPSRVHSCAKNQWCVLFLASLLCLYFIDFCSFQRDCWPRHASLNSVTSGENSIRTFLFSLLKSALFYHCLTFQTGDHQYLFAHVKQNSSK